MTWMLEGLKDYMNECDKEEEYANTLKTFDVKGYAWIEREDEDIAEETRHDFEIEIEAYTARDVDGLIMDLWKSDKKKFMEMIDYPEFEFKEGDYIDYWTEEIDVL